MFCAVVKMKKNWIGHVRWNSLLKILIEGRIVGQKPRGRSRMGMIDDLKEGSCAELKKRTEYREK
jgi:hypothetical protein